MSSILLQHQMKYVLHPPPVLGVISSYVLQYQVKYPPSYTSIGVATYHRCTQRKRYKACMLLNVAAHNVSIRNLKVSKRERHVT
jgi:hypothetical protein